MKNPVVHFEIGCRDAAKTKAFYAEVFEWEINPQSAINPEGEGGISGHITSLGHEPHHYINIYIRVEDIETTLEKVVNSGGTKMVGPLPTPQGESFAWFKDIDGNIVGLLSS